MPSKRNPSGLSYCTTLIRKDVALEPKLAHPKKYPVVKCQRESQRTRINMRFHTGLKCLNLINVDYSVHNFQKHMNPKNLNKYGMCLKSNTTFDSEVSLYF